MPTMAGIVAPPQPAVGARASDRQDHSIVAFPVKSQSATRARPLVYPVPYVEQSNAEYHNDWHPVSVHQVRHQTKAHHECKDQQKRRCFNERQLSPSAHRSHLHLTSNIRQSQARAINGVIGQNRSAMRPWKPLFGMKSENATSQPFIGNDPVWQINEQKAGWTRLRSGECRGDDTLVRKTRTGRVRKCAS
jgi:hypothetical protein